MEIDAGQLKTDNGQLKTETLKCITDIGHLPKTKSSMDKILQF